MNVALRTLHDRLRARGDAARIWADICAAVAARLCVPGGVRVAEVAATAATLGVRGTFGEWRRDLALLGVVDDEERWDGERAIAVGTALEPVGESFDVVGPSAAWAPVATLPHELQQILRPPALRQTAGVLLELIDGAGEEVLLASPFVDQPAVGAVAGSVAAARRRGVNVMVVTSPGRGGEFAALEGDGPHGGGLRIVEVRTDFHP